MRIPEIADRLREKAALHSDPELVALADELRRRPSQKGARSARRMTPDLADQIRTMKRLNPEISQVEISRLLQLNQGRISEVLKGKRA